MAITSNSGTLVQYNYIDTADRSNVEQRGNRTLYSIDLRFRKINEIEHIKWCRRNLGERGIGWDFWMASGVLFIEVWGDKQKFAYEMWKN